jgi:hypothetical protein
MIVVIIVLITAILSLATAILGIINRKKIAEVHVLVNSQLTTVMTRVAQLTKSMEDQGAVIPDGPSGPNRLGSGEVH